MRTLSLWEPWASLIARGLKQWETRHWAVAYRGVIAIHAAKKKFNSADYDDVLRRQLLMDSVDPFYLKYGCAVCFAELVDCVSTESVRDSLSVRECTYGNYADGRFAWRLQNVISIPDPVPLTGHQGIFHWQDGLKLYNELKCAN